MIAAGPAHSGPVSKACIENNEVSNPLLCECIQRVANITLIDSDQPLAAKVMSDPLKMQEVSASPQKGVQNFLIRYEAFGETAAVVCAQD